MNWFQKWLLRTFTPHLERGVRRRIQRQYRRGFQHGYSQGVMAYFLSLPTEIRAEHTINYNRLVGFAGNELDKWVTQEPLDQDLQPPDVPRHLA